MDWTGVGWCWKEEKGRVQSNNTRRRWEKTDKSRELVCWKEKRLKPDAHRNLLKRGRAPAELEHVEGLMFKSLASPIVIVCLVPSV